MTLQVWTLFAILTLSLLPFGEAYAQLEQDAARRDRVVAMLRMPIDGTMMEIARERGEALKDIGFDALPIAYSLIADGEVGADAAFAMLGVDELRALSMIFGSIPQSGPKIQNLAFTWFLDRYDTLRPAHNDARTAALRTLSPIRSTANAEAALYILGLTGSISDINVLEFHAVNFRTRGMRDASEAALMRLGSEPHLNRIRDEIAQPLATTATYNQGVSLAVALQKAAFSGRTELVPAVCSHLQDPPVRESDLRVDTGRSALLALNAIVDGVSITHLPTGRRSKEDWVAYCAQASPSRAPLIPR
jgi:hypothetical protein